MRRPMLHTAARALSTPMSKPRATHLDQCAQTCAVTLPGSSSLGQAVLQLEIWLCQPQELAHDVGDDMVREVRERGYIFRDLTATTGQGTCQRRRTNSRTRARYSKLRDISGCSNQATPRTSRYPSAQPTEWHRLLVRPSRPALTGPGVAAQRRSQYQFRRLPHDDARADEHQLSSQNMIFYAPLGSSWRPTFMSLANVGAYFRGQRQGAGCIS